MSPITFSIDEVVPASPPEIADQLLDLERWKAFQGYGAIPGIAKAEFEAQAESSGDTRILITHSDGTSCVASVKEWSPDTRVTLKLTDFAGPSFRDIVSIEHTLEFEPDEGGSTKLTRFVQINPASESAMPILHDVALDLKKALLLHSTRT
jgi:hypothetical protein